MTSLLAWASLCRLPYQPTRGEKKKKKGLVEDTKAECGAFLASALKKKRKRKGPQMDTLILAFETFECEVPSSGSSEGNFEEKTLKEEFAHR